MKRIGIDARFWHSDGGGIGRVSQSLILNLEKIDRKNQYYIFLRKETYEKYKPKNSNFHKILSDYRWYSIKEQLLFPFILYKYKLDIVYFCNFNIPILYLKKFSVFIHDLTYHKKEFIPIEVSGNIFKKIIAYIKIFLYQIFYKIVIQFLILKSDHIITVSNFSKRIITETLKISSKKIKVLYLGFELEKENKNQDISVVFDKYKIRIPYILYVGTALPHKNLERLITAFSLFDEKFSKIELVFVGREDKYYNNIKRFCIKKGIERVNFVGFVSDEELDFIYKKALLYVAPSLNEGFGLTPLEALARGIPVASSDRGSLPEIIGDAAAYFNPEEIGSIIRALKKVIESDELRKNLIKKGKERAAMFSWEKTAKEFISLYD